jgi:hypothetical protein
MIFYCSNRKLNQKERKHFRMNKNTPFGHRIKNKCIGILPENFPD